MIDETKLKRDKVSNAVLNTDIEELHKYKERKKLFKMKNQKIDALENKVNSLETKLDLILNMLAKG